MEDDRRISPAKIVRETDVIVVGTGFSGIGLGVHLARSDNESFVLLERASSVGGTWRDNTYPGAACDIQSHLYSYSFAPNPDWSRVYAQQPEILAYLECVVDQEALRPHIVFDAEVFSADWDSDLHRWVVTTASGIYLGRFLVTATGHLSDPKMPMLDGLENFAGQSFHSARWDHNLDLSGKRVGVIGTGASSIQVVPAIASRVKHLTVFQRSAPYVIPRHDHLYTDAEKRMFSRVPEVAQALRDKLFWDNEARFPQRRGVPSFIDRIMKIATEHRERQVSDPELRRQLTPDYAIGCKRILISNDYYPALQSPNVTLETDGIARVNQSGVVTHSGQQIDIDVLIACTGFEASDLPIAHRVFGRGGKALADHWVNGGGAYACTSVAGFPNLFVMLGPNTGVGAGSIIYMVETQIAHIMSALSELRGTGTEFEIGLEAENAYINSLDARSGGTVWLTGGCKSWYVDPRNGRLTTLWPDFMSQFRRENGQFRSGDYVVSCDAVVPTPAETLQLVGRA